MNAVEIKEYICPRAELMDLQSEACVLVYSTNDPMIEDFDVIDGKW